MRSWAGVSDGGNSRKADGWHHATSATLLFGGEGEADLLGELKPQRIRRTPRTGIHEQKNPETLISSVFRLFTACFPSASCVPSVDENALAFLLALTRSGLSATLGMRLPG